MMRLDAVDGFGSDKYQPCLWSKNTGYVVPKSTPFITYEDSDIDYLTWAHKLRPAQRGEGKTWCQIIKVAELIKRGGSAGFIVFGNHQANMSRIAVEKLIIKSGIAITRRNQHVTVFENGGSLKVVTPNVTADHWRGERRKWLRDHFVNESPEFSKIELPQEHE